LLTKKQTKKQRNKEIERKQYPASGTYRGRGNKTLAKHLQKCFRTVDFSTSGGFRAADFTQLYTADVKILSRCFILHVTISCGYVFNMLKRLQKCFANVLQRVTFI